MSSLREYLNRVQRKLYNGPDYRTIMAFFGNNATPQQGQAPAPSQPQKQGGMFGEQKPLQPMVPAELVSQVHEITRSIRIGEDRVINLRKKTQMIEHNMLTSQKKMISEVKYLNEEITELKRMLEDLRGNMQILHQTTKGMAKREDIQVLERYISMWEPLKFVTREEVERVVQQVIAKQTQKPEEPKPPIVSRKF